MSKTKKIWLLVGASLILIGTITFITIMSLIGWDFKMLSNHKYQTNIHTVTEEFNSVSIDTTTADITFIPTQNENCSVVCEEQEKLTHSVSVINGTLTVKLIDTRKWYEYIGISFKSPKITVYIPQDEYVDISVKASTAKVSIREISADSIDVSVSTGDVKLTSITCKNDIKIKVTTGDTELYDIKCKNLTSNGSTGDVELKNVIAKEKLSLERTTGDIELDFCDAKDIFAKTSTGDVEGSLLTDKNFNVKTCTGKQKVPTSAGEGKCEITTDTGNVNIRVK